MNLTFAAVIKLLSLETIMSVMSCFCTVGTKWHLKLERFIKKVMPLELFPVSVLFRFTFKTIKWHIYAACPVQTGKSTLVKAQVVDFELEI